MSRNHMREALLLIACHKCERFTSGSCRDPGEDYSPYAEFTADRWCDTCIALAGLEGTLPPRPIEIEGMVARTAIGGAA